MSKPTILFDKDGTLIDTEGYYHIGWLVAFEQIGHPITPEIALKYRSFGTPFAEEFTKELLGPEADIHEIRRLRDIVFFDLVNKNGINFRPYAKATLDFLKEEGFPMVMVTASTKERAIDELTKLGILEYFDDIISAKNLERGKPAPDCYAHACKTLGLDPAETFAVEDSPNGVESAWRAGCKVIMVPDQTQPDERLSKMLYAKCDSLKEVCELLQKEEC